MSALRPSLLSCFSARRCRLALLTLLLFVPAGWAAPPRVGFQVELRWVETRLSDAALNASREGAVVHGTAGSLSPKGLQGPQTDGLAPRIERLPRLQLLNGQQASLPLPGAVQDMGSLDWAVQLDLPGAASATAPGLHVFARPQTAPAAPPSGLRLRLFWPGGREPVQLDYELQEGSGLPWQGSVLLPLDRWQTLLRRGEPAQVLPRGELRSSAAQARIERELQARVRRMEP